MSDMGPTMGRSVTKQNLRLSWQVLPQNWSWGCESERDLHIWTKTPKHWKTEMYMWNLWQLSAVMMQRYKGPRVHCKLCQPMTWPTSWNTKARADGWCFCSNGMSQVEPHLKRYHTHIRNQLGLINLWNRHHLNHGTCSPFFEAMDSSCKRVDGRAKAKSICSKYFNNLQAYLWIYVDFILSKRPRSLGAVLAPASEGCCSAYAHVSVAENRRTAFSVQVSWLFRSWSCLPLSSSRKANNWMIFVLICLDFSSSWQRHFEHPSVPAPWWFLRRSVFPPGGAIEAVQVKFSGRDRFCTGLHPVSLSQTQRKERQHSGGIVRPWYSDFCLRNRRPTWVESGEEVLGNLISIHF